MSKRTRTAALASMMAVANLVTGARRADAAPAPQADSAEQSDSPVYPVYKNRIWTDLTPEQQKAVLFEAKNMVECEPKFQTPDVQTPEARKFLLPGMAIGIAANPKLLNKAVADYKMEQAVATPDELKKLNSADQETVKKFAALTLHANREARKKGDESPTALSAEYLPGSFLHEAEKQAALNAAKNPGYIEKIRDDLAKYKENQANGQKGRAR
jgi:hypothetical protein